MSSPAEGVPLKSCVIPCKRSTLPSAPVGLPGRPEAQPLVSTFWRRCAGRARPPSSKGPPAAGAQSLFALGAERREGMASQDDALASAEPGVAIRRLDGRSCRPFPTTTPSGAAGCRSCSCRPGARAAITRHKRPPMDAQTAGTMAEGLLQKCARTGCLPEDLQANTASLLAALEEALG